jgi:nucleoid DNA-binding protein
LTENIFREKFKNLAFHGNLGNLLQIRLSGVAEQRYRKLYGKPQTKENEMAKSAKPATKSEIISKIAEATELSRKQVASVFEALSSQIKSGVGKKGPGIFVVPGLMKIMVVHKPATPERKGINPFTKQEQVFKAKPARNVIKVRPLKALKDMAK